MTRIHTQDLPDHLYHTIKEETAKILLNLSAFELPLRVCIAESALLHFLYYAHCTHKRVEIMESMLECAKITWEIWEKEDNKS